MSYGEPTAEPRQGDCITVGPLTIRVGRSNGDFRAILVEDHFGRPIAHGDVPYEALRQIREVAVPWSRAEAGVSRA